MTMHAKALALLLTLIVTTFSTQSMATTEHTKEPKIHEELKGRWSPDCKNIEGIKISNTNSIRVYVNRNQIYISSRGELTGSIMKIFLTSPDELGRGGMMLDWDNYSRKHAVILFKLISKNSANVEWLGFYNKKNKAREWVNEPDFSSASNIFIKCND